MWRMFFPFKKSGATVLSPTVIALAGILVHGIFIPAAVPESSKGIDEPEIRWEDAAAEVDSFPFSPDFIDSVRVHHAAPVPEKPLRILTDSAFCVPETLVYDVGWGPFKAGYAVIATRYDPETGHITMSAKALSNNFVGAFYRMRDHVLSTIDMRGLYPVFFEQHLREGKRYRANEYIIFDQSNGKVHVQSRKKFQTKDIPPFTHDYLSVLYLLRSHHDLVPGDTFSEQLYIHSKVHSMFFSVSASKPCETDAGTFPCLLLVPRLVGEGRAFNKKDKLEIWFSDDRRRLPVEIRSKIKFGSIHARLRWYNSNRCSSGPLKG